MLMLFKIFLLLVFDTIAVKCHAFNCVFRLLSVFNTSSQTARCSPSLKTRKLQLSVYKYYSSTVVVWGVFGLTFVPVRTRLPSERATAMRRRHSGPLVCEHEQSNVLHPGTLLVICESFAVEAVYSKSCQRSELRNSPDCLKLYQ